MQEAEEKKKLDKKAATSTSKSVKPLAKKAKKE